MLEEEQLLKGHTGKQQHYNGLSPREKDPMQSPSSNELPKYHINVCEHRFPNLLYFDFIVNFHNTSKSTALGVNIYFGVDKIYLPSGDYLTFGLKGGNLNLNVKYADFQPSQKSSIFSPPFQQGEVSFTGNNSTSKFSWRFSSSSETPPNLMGDYNVSDVGRVENKNEKDHCSIEGSFKLQMLDITIISLPPELQKNKNLIQQKATCRSLIYKSKFEPLSGEVSKICIEKS